jgi:hypothetical protein
MLLLEILGYLYLYRTVLRTHGTLSTLELVAVLVLVQVPLYLGGNPKIPFEVETPEQSTKIFVPSTYFHVQFYVESRQNFGIIRRDCYYFMFGDTFFPHERVYSRPSTIGIFLYVRKLRSNG